VAIAELLFENGASSGGDASAGRQREATVEYSTLLDLLHHRSVHTPDKRVYTFLTDRGAESEWLTYADLDQRARAIAGQIQQIVGPGEPVLLIYRSGLEFICAFFACLYADVIAVPVCPPRRNQIDFDHVDAIRKETSARLALTADEDDKGWCASFPRYLATRPITSEGSARWRKPTIEPDTIAFLQYTSGSTASPKGVMVTHKNILYNQRIIQTAFEHTANTMVVGWLPLYHDMGLIGNVLQPLFVGGSCVLMSPTSFLLKPLRWLEAISRFQAHTSGAPNFAYELCVRKITAEQRATLDLSKWELAYSGSECVSARTMDRFADAFGPCGFRREAFYPCYGLAEATLFVTGGLKREAPVLDDFSHEPGSSRKVVSCGWTRLGHDVRIVDPNTSSLRQSGEHGEVWVSGPCVTQGYWNRFDETNNMFRAFTADGQGPFLRTGDLGYVKDNHLFVLGRVKDVIIIRGCNHSPEDIERTVEQGNPEVRPGCGAAFSIQVGDEERLVIAYEVERDFRSSDLGRLVDGIRRTTANQHGLQTHRVLLLERGTVPRTSSGKIQRSRCRDAYLRGCLQTIAVHGLQRECSTDVSQC
jgi:acyl-CoA synthetase (AMP-forming)/AMP-acid ligase II